ncbi:MAG: globin domain-containing protein [Pseudomonadota bacterium]
MFARNDVTDILSKSFAAIARNPDDFAEQFYCQLFEIAPDLRLLFKDDLRAQGRKVVSTLGVVVAGIHRGDVLKPVLSDLARRHVAYGVEPHHYEIVGKALMQTLARMLGEDAPALDVWRVTYGAVAQAMIDAAYPDANNDDALILEERAA